MTGGGEADLLAAAGTDCWLHGEPTGNGLLTSRGVVNAKVNPKAIVPLDRTSQHARLQQADFLIEKQKPGSGDCRVVLLMVTLR